MGWPLWSTLVPRLPDLLRYQHHNCWNTSEWELILHSLHHLCHLHCELRLAVRSTGPPRVCQHWLRHTGIGWGSTFSFPSSFISCLGSIPDLLPTSRYSPHLHLSLGHFLTSRLLSSLTPHFKQLHLILLLVHFFPNQRTLSRAGSSVLYVTLVDYKVLRPYTSAPTSTHSWHPLLAHSLVLHDVKYSNGNALLSFNVQSL